jgi:Predicted membrane protein
MTEAARQHGRQAERPSDIPARGWLEIGRRVWNGISHHELSVVSAGIAFNEFFALFPTLAAAISLYGLVADPGMVQDQLDMLGGFLPAEVQSLVAGQMESLARTPDGSLGLSLVIALALALWGATRGVKGLISGLNIVHGEDERRGFFALNLTALAFTFGAIVFGLVALALVAAVPAILGFLPLGDGLRALLSFVRWPLLAVFMLAGLGVVYRFAPSRRPARWRWISWGAGVAVGLWLVGSGLFSLYAAHFGNFNESYGSMAAVAVTLLWFQLTSFIVLLGALLDAEMEHQTTRDTTTGAERPMGRRGAHMADTVEPPVAR